MLGINTIQSSIRAKLNLYKRRANQIEGYLEKKPNEWGRFQSEFNSEVNNIFRESIKFEKENLLSGQDGKVFKLKKLFVKRLRKLFCRGVYGPWSLAKPFGYAGDFKIIDDIYQNSPTTTGFDRLFDNYFQMSAISVAVRNRKEDFKRLINNFINSKQNRKIAIMNLASGPCRDIKEMLLVGSSLYENVIFDCYDHDERAIEYAEKLLSGYPNINFIKENAIRLAFRRDISALIGKKYDLIYSTGLFDYFNERIGIALVSNLKKLLNPNGILAISTMRDKYSNPSVHYMEWVGDWNLVYRDEEEFRRVFMEGGFSNEQLEIQYEQQGIMQYVYAFKS